LDLFDDIRKDGHMIIMVTHDENTIKKANKIIKIVDGAIQK
jgi:ABC-type lipoprotein export system ATPase subunit